MNDQVKAIARSVLYEGYILWPYRRSALKNQRRWTFGGVYPRDHSNAGHPDDAWLMRSECVLETTGLVDLTITVRFLHVVDRRVVQGDTEERFVDALSVDGVNHVSWQEAVEREVVVSLEALRTTAGTRRQLEIAIEPGSSRERLVADDGRAVGSIVRSWDAISGWIDVAIAPVGAGAARVSVEIRNESAWNGETREEVQRRTLVATHTEMHAVGGAFVSPIDPPPHLAEHVAACRNLGTWPVLVGTPPDRDTMLSSPIILYDYPQVAPESSGDFFDAAEIDQLLVLGVLSMTDEEQARMAESDPRAREILERCRSLSAEDLLRLHGVTRDLRVVEAEQ